MVLWHLVPTVRGLYSQSRLLKTSIIMVIVAFGILITMRCEGNLLKIKKTIKKISRRKRKKSTENKLYF